MLGESLCILYLLSRAGGTRLSIKQSASALCKLYSPVATSIYSYLKLFSKTLFVRVFPEPRKTYIQPSYVSVDGGSVCIIVLTSMRIRRKI